MGKTLKVRTSFEEYTHLLKEYIKKYHRLPLKRKFMQISRWVSGAVHKNICTAKGN